MDTASAPLLRRTPESASQATAPETSKSRSPAKDPTLLTWDELPDWQRDNEYLLTSYRPATYSYWLSFFTLGHLHNETVNIFSHLLGAAIFFLSPIYLYRERYVHHTDASTADVIVFSTFFFGVATCFLLSSTFHIFANHSPPVNAFGNQLDYLGIVILMWGSTIPSVYYGFYCDPFLQNVYWINVTIFAALCTYATLHPSFRTPRLRPYRTLMYTLLGLSAISFVTHGILKYGREAMINRMSIDWMALMAVLNLVGAATYAARVPEAWFPKKFDIWGSSHQGLHVLVIGAGIAHWAGLARAFDFNHSVAGNC